MSAPDTPVFRVRDGEAWAEGVKLSAIAAAVGTPVYVYSRAALTGAYRRLEAALAGLDASICYAVKANGNLAVVRTFAGLGAGADVVSGGELRRALQAGVPAARIVFAGVGKTEAELELGLDAGILQFNVESEPELALLSQLASRKNRRAQVALRVNPDVDAKTHAKITTGRAENKFGVDLARAGAVAQRAARLPGIAFAGVAVHIGSQLSSLDPFRAAFARVAALVKELRGLGLDVRRIDLGGGLDVGHGGEAAPYLESYARIVRETVGTLGCALIVEPGRMLVAEAGLLLTRIIYMKEGAARRFAIVDAAMNDLIRPTLYDAYHPIRPVKAPAPGAAETPVDIVGPICETSDQFAAQRPMPPTVAGDLLAVLSTGAYGFAMASTYNLRPLPAEVMVDGDHFAVVRPRQSYDSLLGAEAAETEVTGGPRAQARAKSAG